MQELGNDAGRVLKTPIARPRGLTPRILVVDDEPDACEAIRQVLEGEGYSATKETSAANALEKIANQDFDLVLSDVSMDEMSGLDLCRHVAETRPGLPVILLTGRGSMSTVIDALRIGATDFLTKPIGAEALTDSVTRALRYHARRGEAAQPKDGVLGPVAEHAVTGLLGQSASIRHLRQMVADLSGSVASVIIQGETGTGKEIIARAIHASSRFSKGPFVALSCAAMPAGLLESELFGHARGAFTDAKSARSGLLVQAHGGTLLFDEIGELPLAMQPKLLRALQERTVRPVGEHEEVPFDCRIIAATNRDLDVEVSEKRFREDLYYRIDVVRIKVPPLRERGDDILLLARHFLARFATSARRTATLTPSAEERLLAYRWPGNVRELENCMERAVSLARSDELTAEDLPERIRFSDTRDELPSKRDPDPDLVSLFELERRHILRAIKLLGGNKTLAAELLGIDRSTLYRRLEQYESAGSN